MLCSKNFGGMMKTVGLGCKNCKRCGKAVCENCAKHKRRLSKLEDKVYRVCDECDTVLANYNLDQMFAREVASKRQLCDDTKE